MTVTWGLSCPKTAHDGKDKGTGGTYVTTPPQTSARSSFPSATIAFCAVRAEAQLRGSGRVKVTLLASPAEPERRATQRTTMLTSLSGTTISLMTS